MLEKGPWASEATRRGTCERWLTISGILLLFLQVTPDAMNRIVRCKCGQAIGATSPATEDVVKLDKRRVTLADRLG